MTDHSNDLTVENLQKAMIELEKIPGAVLKGSLTFHGFVNSPLAMMHYQGMSQYRCPGCGVPVDGVLKHGEGCMWLVEQARMMQNVANTNGSYGEALQNAYRWVEPEEALAKVNRVGPPVEFSRYVEYQDTRSRWRQWLGRVWGRVQEFWSA